MTARRRGRPPAGAAPIGDAGIVAAGLALLDEGGEGAVTLRAVARRLGVTPMAVAHRAGGRDGLLAWVIAAAHAGFAPPDGQGAAATVAAVLAYAEAARRHPAAVAALFARPDLMPPSLAALSDWLRGQLAARDPAMAAAGLALVVDYVHGHLLAAAAARPDAEMEATFRANVTRLVGWLLEG